MNKRVEGFSRLSKTEKIEWVSKAHFKKPKQSEMVMASYQNGDPLVQKRHDEFIENTLTNFYLPLGVAPNFIINDKPYTLPMAIEESSVVAAACKAAKFWGDRGGFKTRIIATEKVGQVHFLFKGSAVKMEAFFNTHKDALLKSTQALTENMEKRGGGIVGMELRNKTAVLPHYFQLHVRFQTADAMGANFINSCLEQLADSLKLLALKATSLSKEEQNIEVVMSILSNYVPNCLVEAKVSCPIADLGAQDGVSAKDFAQKFIQALAIADGEPYRAVTHNKGIMNGVDALVIATGNDFRAVEAGVHAYAARSGQYRSLSKAEIKDGHFEFSLQLPLALGTVGGLTKLHPMVVWSLELLDHPNAEELMQITAVAGLAQNFAALRSLVTSGIQKGHMKMHLLNILNQYDASSAQKIKAVAYFKTHAVTTQSVQQFLRQNPN